MAAFKVTQARLAMRKRIRQVGAQPGQVIASELHETATETRAAIGRTDTIKPPPVKRMKRATVELQRQLRRICCDRRDDAKSIAVTLLAVGNTIRFRV